MFHDALVPFAERRIIIMKIRVIILRAINAYFVHIGCKFSFLYVIISEIMCIYVEICSLVKGELQLYEENDSYFIISHDAWNDCHS